jgi:hypothetical protein
VGGTLYLNGGRVAGSVTIPQAADASTDPGGVLQGGGTIEGLATLAAAITSGSSAGVITFKGDIMMLAGTSFW